MLRDLARIIATGTSFTVFSIGCFVIVAVFYPVVLTFYRQAQERQSRFRRIISVSFRLFVYQMKVLGLLTYDISELETPPPGTLIVANHPSLIDVIFLLGWMPDASCVVKGALFRNVFTFGPVTCAGYINNDDPEFIDVCIENLQYQPLLLFAEGTRSVPGTEPKFLRGAANIALMSGCRILPISISVEPITLYKNQHWWGVPDTTPVFTFSVHPTWELDDYRDPSLRQSYKARVLTRDLESFFKDQLQSVPSA